jgi:hypothetical protein
LEYQLIVPFMALLIPSSTVPVPQRDPLTAVGVGGFDGFDKTTGLLV